MNSWTCSACEGRGWQETEHWVGSIARGHMRVSSAPCETCRGYGHIDEDTLDRPDFGDLVEMLVDGAITIAEFAGEVSRRAWETGIDPLNTCATAWFRVDPPIRHAVESCVERIYEALRS